MDERFYSINFADYQVHYYLKNQNTYRWFGWHIKASNNIPDKSIVLSETIRNDRRHFFRPNTPDDFIEYRLLVNQTAHSLAEKNRFLFHSVAFIWQNQAWLLTAPSGIGKTTQYLNWKKLWPGEIQILCGDMPLLYRREDGKIWVFPSPWNGSERYGAENHLSAPLGGIVYLKQEKMNRISIADLHQYIVPVWNKLVDFADTERQILSWSGFLNDMLNRYPLWLLENRGDMESAILTRAAFENYLEKGTP